MKQPAIYKQIENFNRDYIGNYEDARRIILSYRRLCFLSARNCEMENDIRTCNSDYLKQQEAREEKHIKRLQSYLNKYNLVLEFPGIYPIICTIGEDGRPANHAYMY